jgi:lipid II:glycine glycyltransferase (peptidoglycan interpeptide bridge formation enzyme)
MYNEYMTSLKQCQDKRVWDDYIIDHDGHPLQLWGWGEIKTSHGMTRAVHGWKAQRLFFYDNDESIIGAVQLLVRSLPWPLRSLAYVPRGPVVNEKNNENLLLELAKYVKRVHKSVALMIEPDSIEYAVPQGWKRSKNHILPVKTILLDLKKSEPELLNDMTKKTRQYIRKSASEAMKIKMVHSEAELDKCIAIYKITAKRAKFNLHEDQYYHDVFNKLGDHSPLFAAYVDDQPIAFLMLAISTNIAFELYGGMDDLGQQLRANYALKWHAIRKCKEWGLNRYDFGGLIDGGVTTFKLSWADKETEFAGTFDKPLSVFYGLWSSCMPIIKKIVQKIKRLKRR